MPNTLLACVNVSWHTDQFEAGPRMSFSPMEWLNRDLVALALLFVVFLMSLRSSRSATRAPVPVDDLPALEVEWKPSFSVFEQPERFGYTAYTRKHDRIVDARDLPAEPGAEERGRLLDQIVRSQAEATLRLARRLREMGVERHVCASILIDHSGSLRRKVGEDVGGPVDAADSGAALAAAIAISLAEAQESCGAATELLGFTTGEWKGGKSRLDWINAGGPPRPGRLNDLLHIVYKGVEEPSVADCAPRLAHLLNRDLLKENIDGEAIAWARARLLATFASDRLLVVISDGASVDDSTLYENGPSYMERHLLHVLGDIERRRDLRVVGIGIGHDVSRYIPNSVAIASQVDFDDRLDAVAALLAGQSRT